MSVRQIQGIASMAEPHAGHQQRLVPAC